MKYYPVCLDIAGRQCLVVGGGAVGSRKVKTLLACGARVTVISPAASTYIHEQSAKGNITYQMREYRRGDLKGMFLTIGATSDEELNFKIHREAEKTGKLCNIADRPKACNFILPSIVARGDLLIAISTSGKSPAFAKRLRKQLETEFGPEYADFLQLMGSIRKQLLAESHEPEEHKPLFEQLIENGLLKRIAAGQTAEIDRLLSKTLGPGYRYDALMKME